MLKKIILVLVLITILSSCGSDKEQKVEKFFSTHIVQTWNLSSLYNFTGYTAWTKEVMLSTKAPWRIVYLNKNVWDKVRSGELLVRLDSIEAKSWYATSSSIINNLYDLRKQTWLVFDSQIESTNIQIKQAKIWIKWVKTELEDTKNIIQNNLELARSWINKGELWVETSQKKLEETKKTLEANKKNTLQWAKSAIIQSLILYKYIIDFNDKTLWITDKNKNFNDDFEDFLGRKDSIHIKETEALFRKTKTIFLEFEKFYNEKIQEWDLVKNNKEISEEVIIKWLKLAEKTAESQKVLLEELYKVIENSIENIHFSADSINEYKKNIITMAWQIESSLLTINWNFVLWIKWSLQNIENLKIEKNKVIILLEKQLELAQENLNTANKTYNKYKNINDWQVHSVITKKDMSKNQLKKAFAWLEIVKSKKEASLKEIDLKIAKAQWSRSEAWIMIYNWKIFSNITGIITMKIAEVGEVVSGWMPIYKVVDNSEIVVKISVPSNILKNLKKGQKINLNIEWLNKKVEWKISLISKDSNKITKKYDIEIKIDNSKWDIPLWRMTRVTIEKQNYSEKSTNILIPNSSIISKFSIPAVYVLKDWRAILKTIEIVKMWETESEITWIEAFDEIIVYGKENIFDWEILKY